MSDLSPVAIATKQQGRATDPAASVWVSASAGTGKTKVLTDRVLALMLNGTAPHRILCLTFTKAAAAEMANRIARDLSDWVTLDDETLAPKISALLGHPPEARDLTVARRLFARVLETPGGMKIQTIHAFCQSVLRRFPLEAGLAPHFDLLSDQDAFDLLDTAQEAVISRAHHDGDDDLARALSVIVSRVHELRFPELMADVTNARDKLAHLLVAHGSVTGAVAALRAELELSQADTADSVLQASCSNAAIDGTGLKAAAAALSGGTKTDIERGGVISEWLSKTTEDRAGPFNTYVFAFLTTKGEVRAKLATKAVAASHPDAVDTLHAEAERLTQVFNRLQAVEVVTATAALLTIGKAFLDEYQVRKAALARLDYDDLIQRTRALLEQPGLAAWVLFKLDGGLDHLLIDEAQDTSPDQWAVVQALTDEFFAGEGRHEDRAVASRTAFAVGDRKQSIYSFQGAAPEGFDQMRAYFRARVTQADQTWTDVDLGVSFRSTQTILRAVDAVFAHDPARNGVTLPGETLTCLASRQGQAGVVEVWPPIDPDEVDDPKPWKPPVERLRGQSAPTRLARLIAKRIERLCRTEQLESKNRSINPGDILVLVRRRTGFVDDLVRALKDLNIPVAGVDRMVLIEQMAVMDLVALGRFLLLPQDDLTLAAVLKSPLIGLTEDDLFELAHDRGEHSLWSALSKHDGAESVFGVAHGMLSEVLGQTDYRTPFALYAHVLTFHNGRRNLLSRLGMDADDPIDEFLAQALEYERHHTPSLEGFLHWLERGRLEVKRDLEQTNRNAVRVMTVHGAKGLQAPIVFLPDTLQTPSQSDPLLWKTDKAGKPLLLWAPRAADRNTQTAETKANADAARDREYRRLLYVAMTRAEDRLYVCGWNTARTAPETCWYSLIKTALSPLADEIADPFLADATNGEGMILRLFDPQTAAHEAGGKPEDEIPEIDVLPPFASNTAASEPAPPKPLAPSRPDMDDPPVSSPLGADTSSRFQRGLLIHRLLQSLPDLPIDVRKDAADRFLARPAWGLTKNEISDLSRETIAVLETKAFAPLFGSGSKAEVPVTGLIDGRVLSGQVDRLIVTETAVMVIDYKTNRPPPKDVSDVSPVYLSQMAAYRAALQAIYPKHKVRCVLLWTDGPFMMELPDEALAG